MDDPSMKRARELFRQSGLMWYELGVGMGYPRKHARKSVLQFLRGHDPRIGTLRKFADAMGVPIEELVRPDKE